MTPSNRCHCKYRSTIYTDSHQCAACSVCNSFDPEVFGSRRLRHLHLDRRCGRHVVVPDECPGHYHTTIYVIPPGKRRDGKTKTDLQQQFDSACYSEPAAHCGPGNRRTLSFRRIPEHRAGSHRRGEDRLPVHDSHAMRAFMAAPFRALLISHENIVYISAIDVINGVLKIIIAVAIARSDADRLIFTRH